MYGRLPKTLNINGKEYAIRSDFRDCLNILIACDDPDLNKNEKIMVILKILYPDYKSFKEQDMEEAINKAIWFLNCGDSTKSETINSKKVYDWEQDEQMIFSAINKVSNKELRSEEYVHFWTFLGYFHEIGEGLFSTVINIRQKKNNGKKLEKYEQEFYKKNKSIIDLKKRYSKEQQAEIDYINSLLN